MIDRAPLLAALAQVRRDLVAERTAAGHWVGQLSSSALSTATAVSALAVVRSHTKGGEDRFDDLIASGLRYLAAAQRADGGWGDTDRSHSNIATTMLAQAAMKLTGEDRARPSGFEAAERYVAAQGGVAGLRRRYGRDKTFAVPILANAAIAGMAPWSSVAPLPFELAVLPQSWYRFLRLPVVSYAIPALVAIGQARFVHRPPWNPLTRAIRAAAVERSLRVLEEKQPESGGFLEATPLTSFVVTSLASIGRGDHPVVQRGVRFLLDSARADGSWPIDTNLATWNTTLAVNALAAGPRDETTQALFADPKLPRWILDCQHRLAHAYTGAAPGGWGWTDLSGGVPDVDDTSGALLALRALFSNAGEASRREIQDAARRGVAWLLELQNSDGGWPTFCRGWGKLPFDRSGCDLTAHALRAIAAWRQDAGASDRAIEKRIASAANRGLRFLNRTQREDGSWVPLWFGNQDDAAEENPVYGTARVLLAFGELALSHSPGARRAANFLAHCQRDDGGWGGGASTVEETALAVEGLMVCASPSSEHLQIASERGLAWLIEKVEESGHRQPAPIGFYFARLWYYESLYPLVFATSALGSAAARLLPPEPFPPTTSRAAAPGNSASLASVEAPIGDRTD